jgi:predicted P-loop ATPase
MVGAVRRVFVPGTKMDTVLILTGKQGALKSTFFRILAGEDNFGDSPIDLESKEGPMVLHRSWFNEFAEIDHVTSNRDVERLKAFLSTSKDIFRPTYGRSVGVFPRSCVIVGTANKDELLVDPTGSRRFWPIKIGKTLELGLLAGWRDQLWAEAMDAFNQGVDHWLPPEIDTLRAEDARKFEAEDPWESQVDQALASFSRAGRLFSLEGVSTADVMSQMGIPVSQQTRGSGMKVAQILKSMGWHCRGVGERRLKRWFPSAEDTD